MSKKKKKRNEKKKKIQSTKTKLKRQEEIQKVQLQLQQIGFSSDNPDIKYAYSIFNDYIEYGTAFTGKIKINGFIHKEKFFLQQIALLSNIKIIQQDQ